MLASWLLIAALTLGALPLAAQDTASPAQPAYDRAEAFAFDQNNRAARVELLNAIQEDPDWPAAHLALAMTNLRLFDPVGAQMELRTAARLGVAPSQLRHLLGEAYWLQGRYADALRQLDAGDVAPEHRIDAARIAARVYMDQGNMDAARAAFDRAFDLGGDDAPLWTDLGRFRLVAGDMGGAIAAADRAIAVDGRDVRALEFRGRLVRNQYGLAAALPWFEQGLSEAPDDVPLLVEYGSTLGDLGRHRDMLKVARRIVALQPGNPRGYYMQAVIAARAHQFALAKRLIAKTDGAMANLPSMLLLSGAVEYGLGNDRVAAGYWTRLAEMQPLNASAQMLAARALYRAGDAESAADRLSAQRAADGGSYGKLVLARALEAGGRRGDAMNLLNAAQAADITSDRAFSYDGDGPAAAIRSAVAAGDLEGAMRQASDLQRRNPGVADAHMLLGDVLAEADDPGAALAAYERAAALDFSPPLMLRMVALARRLGEGATERAVLTRFLRFNPADVEARRLLADAYLASGEDAEAAGLYAGLIAVIGPNDAMLQVSYARALANLGQTDKALRHARLAYRVQPGNPVAVHIYGYVALRAGQADEAVALLEKAVTLLPGNALARQQLAQARAEADAV